MGVSLRHGLIYFFVTAITWMEPVRSLFNQSSVTPDEDGTIENTIGVGSKAPLPDTLNFLGSSEANLERAGLNSGGTAWLLADQRDFHEAFARQQRGMQDSAGAQAFRSFLQEFSNVESKSLSQLATEVNSKVNGYLTWEEDGVVYNKSDYMASTMESVANKKGDCDDYAAFKYFTLRALGVPADRLYLAGVETTHTDSTTGYHMILMMNIAETGKQFVMLDNRFSDPAAPGAIAAGDAKPYEFRDAINEKGGWFSPEGKRTENMWSIIQYSCWTLSTLSFSFSFFAGNKRKKGAAQELEASEGPPVMPDFLVQGVRKFKYIARPADDTLALLAKVAGQKKPDAPEKTPNRNTLDLLAKVAGANKQTPVS